MIIRPFAIFIVKIEVHFLFPNLNSVARRFNSIPLAYLKNLKSSSSLLKSRGTKE